MIKIEHNVQTNKIEKIELTVEELREVQSVYDQNAITQLKEQAEAEAKAAAQSTLLSKLGITKDEAKLLLGGN